MRIYDYPLMKLQV